MKTHHFILICSFSLILDLVCQTQSSVSEDFPLPVAEWSRSKGGRVGNTHFKPVFL